MSISVLLNDDSEKITCAPVMDILFVLCLFNVYFSCQACNFGHGEEKFLLHPSILSCFNRNKVVRQFFIFSPCIFSTFIFSTNSCTFIKTLHKTHL